MAETKFTAGPWEVTGEGTASMNIFGGTKHICNVPNALYSQRDSAVLHPSSAANANLIAASPELLEALRRILTWYQGNTAANARSFGESYYSTYLSGGSIAVTKRLRDEGAAAIAKAEGRNV